MKKVFTKIEQMIADNLTHNRKNFRLGEVQPAFILGQVIEELRGLMDAPDGANEMADLLGSLFCYCVKQGWGPDEIEARITAKLDLRFV